jgi:acyl-CoA thioesterase
MTDTIFSNITGQMTETADGLTAPVPANWMQGRTTFGGLSAAMLLRAVQMKHPDLPPLRSALINFVGPVSESPVITTEFLRRGRNVASIEARVTINGQVVCTGSFAFGASQTSGIRVDATGPSAPRPEDTEPLIPAAAASFAPKFHHNFELLLIEGDRPMSGSDRGYIRAWARHRDPASHNGIVPLLCLADILPPAVFPLFKRLGANSSMTWICNFLDDAPHTKDGWWQVETSLTAARDGYSSQVMRMWNSDGQLVVDGMQSVVIFV